MTIILKAKTHCAYTIKILAELLQHNIKTACFEVDADGIKLCMMDHHRTILINLYLESENFSLYKFKSNKKLFLGINLNHFYKMLKSIKKKDSIQLFIDGKSPTDLGIKVIPKENNNRVTTSFVKIQDIQTLDIDLPDEYNKSIIVSSSEYQKMCKDMQNIGTTINVVSSRFSIKFMCDAGGVLKRHVEFGETDYSDDEDDEEDTKEEYNAVFNTDQLSRISKIAGLGNNIQIYSTNGKPLLIKSDVGSLGKISLYIKSKELVDRELYEVESDDE